MTSNRKTAANTFAGLKTSMASANIRRAVALISTSYKERGVKEKLAKPVRGSLGINWCLLSFVTGVGYVEKGQLKRDQLCSYGLL
jgi:hypothetical protein